MKASIVVPTFNRRAVIRRTIETLFQQDSPPGTYEIIVVVDGATDGTAADLRNLVPPCRFRIIEQENRGLAGARNTGWRAAESELVVFLDDDMLCTPSLVSEYVRAHEASGPIAAFGAIFLSLDSPRTLAAECFNCEIGAFHLRQSQKTTVALPASAWVFGNTSVPRRVLLEVGGFDERFRMREDADLAIRLFAAGVTPCYIPKAIAYQFYTKTASDLIRDAEAFAPADLLLVQKHPEELPHTFLGRINREPFWKRTIRDSVATVPGLSDLLLAPVCWAGDRLFELPRVRSLGVRALQTRRGIHWYHRVRQLNKVAL